MPYADGNRVSKFGAEGEWAAEPGDLMFETYSSSYVFSPPYDIATVRRLCAAAKNTFYYEDIE